MSNLDLDSEQSNRALGTIVLIYCGRSATYDKIDPKEQPVTIFCVRGCPVYNVIVNKQKKKNKEKTTQQLYNIQFMLLVNSIVVLTRSTQRAQTSLAEADHYSHIAHCKNVEPWLLKTTHPPKKKKKKKKSLDH